MTFWVVGIRRFCLAQLAIPMVPVSPRGLSSSRTYDGDDVRAAKDENERKYGYAPVVYEACGQ